MIFKRVIFMFFIYILNGCDMGVEADGEKKILALIESKCLGSNECLIDFNDLLPSKWDEVFIFSDTGKNYIQEKIKIPYTLYKDIGVKIIFIKDGKIAYYSELFPTLDTKETKSKLIVSFDERLWSGKQHVNYYRLTPDNAKMKVVKQSYSNDGISNIAAFIMHPENLSQIGG